MKKTLFLIRPLFLQKNNNQETIRIPYILLIFILLKRPWCVGFLILTRNTFDEPYNRTIVGTSLNRDEVGDEEKSQQSKFVTLS